MRFADSKLPDSLFVTAAALALTATTLHAGPYSFAKLAQSGGPLESFGVPAVNAGGAVAFFAYPAAGGQGIYRADGSGVTTIAVTSEEGFYSFTGCGSMQLVSSPAIDGPGHVFFRGYTFDPDTWDCWESIYCGEGSGVAAVTDSGAGGDLYSDWCNPSASASEVLAFRGRDGEGTIGIYRSASGAAPELVIDDSGELQSFSDPDVNDAGEVVFYAYDALGREGIYVTSGGAPAVVARTDFGYWSISQEAAIAGGPVVAFLAEDAEWSHAVFIWDGALAEIADDLGPYSGFYAVSVNDSRDVAFRAETDEWITGIFTGPDPVADRVIAGGDSLFGSVVTSLECGRHALNDAGQVAFVYQLESGESGIALASPGTTTSVKGGAPAGGASLAISNPFPNPTRAGASLELRLPAGTERYEASVYDASGRLVRRMTTRAAANGGRVATWDGGDEAGRAVAAGPYFFRVSAGGRTASARVLVVR